MNQEFSISALFATVGAILQAPAESLELELAFVAGAKLKGADGRIESYKVLQILDSHGMLRKNANGAIMGLRLPGAPKPKEGRRVQMTSRLPGATIPIGARGTIGKVAGFRGASIYCDPSRLMVFVFWDSYRPQGVFRRELKILECDICGRAATQGFESGAERCARHSK